MNRVITKRRALLLLLLLTLPLAASAQQDKQKPAGSPTPQQMQPKEEPCVPSGATHLTFSPDNRLLLSGGPEWGLRLFDVESGRELRRFNGGNDIYPKTVFAPDGTRAASYGWGGTIFLWDLKTGKEIGRLQGHKGGTAQLSFSTDGMRIASGGESDMMIKVWEVETGRELSSHVVSDKFVHQILISPTGKRALSFSPEEDSYLWDTDSGAKIRRFKYESIYFSGYGRHVVFSTGDKTFPFVLWDLETGTESLGIKFLKDELIEAISADGKRALIVSEPESQHSYLDLVSGEVISRLESEKGEYPRATALSPDGLLAAMSSKDKICIWDLKTGRRIRCFN